MWPRSKRKLHRASRNPGLLSIPLRNKFVSVTGYTWSDDSTMVCHGHATGGIPLVSHTWVVPLFVVVGNYRAGSPVQVLCKFPAVHKGRVQQSQQHKEPMYAWHIPSFLTKRNCGYLPLWGLEGLRGISDCWPPCDDFHTHIYVFRISDTSECSFTINWRPSQPFTKIIFKNWRSLPKTASLLCASAMISCSYYCCCCYYYYYCCCCWCCYRCCCCCCYYYFCYYYCYFGNTAVCYYHFYYCSNVTVVIYINKEYTCFVMY